MLYTSLQTRNTKHQHNVAERTAEKESHFASAGPLDTTGPDLGLDLLGRVGEEDRGGGITGAHLGLRALQRREEGGVDEGRLVVAQPRSDVAGHAEVGVLKRSGKEPSEARW